MWYCLLLALLGTSFAQNSGPKHGQDSTVCSVSPTPAPGIVSKTMPTVSSQFSAHIECVIVNKNMTTDLHEYYDDTNNRGAVHQLDLGLELDAWYDYNTNEFIAYYKPTQQCFVQKLGTSDQRFLFGYTPKGAVGSIFSAGKMLHMNGPGINQVYTGVQSYRGIMVDTWQSCQYWAAYDATMKVSWYFSNPNEWDTSVGQVVPVGAYVKGIVYDTNTVSHPMEHYYNFFHFRPTVDDPTVFETPAGVQCPGRQNTKNLPKMPNGFSFTSEFIDKTRYTISFMQEFYDYSGQAVLYNYRPLKIENNKFGTNTLMEVHDFSTGVAYVTDTMHGNCTAQKIETTFDDRRVDLSHVSMRNPAQFFYFDVINYTYEGVKKIRNIDCDSWVGIRTNWPSSGVNTTWMWYFATADWVQVNTGTEQSSTPIRLTIDNGDVGIHYEYNLYNFAKNKPDILKFDISACYVNGNRRKFQLNFPGSYAGAVTQNMKLFKYYILISLTQQLQISSLRVANLKVFIDQDILVVFEILDVAPIKGDVTNIVQETPLLTAANKLVKMVNNDQFFVLLQDPAFKNLVGMVPKKTGFVEITYLLQNTTSSSDTGNGPGTMAAVGVVMPIVGGVLGGLFSYFFFK
ncbi:uncharacterized protein [Mytilus edulis]|uniref:uncharacterized protein n=1 Tax=Mytilus edulis TaxID=6550 RepID=UPI0039EEBBA6